jgi:hypothetical protein
MLIGLCGPAGCGKTTVAEALQDRHGFTVISFADPLYGAVSAITGLSTDELKDRSIKESPLPGIGKSPRFLLQTLGTEWGRTMVSKTLWIDLAMGRAEKADNAVIADVRFDNEAEAIRERGGKVFYITRPGWQCLEAKSFFHPSEKGVSMTLIDGYIENDGTVDQLLLQASQNIMGIGY